MIPTAKGQGTLKQALPKSGPLEIKMHQVFVLLHMKIILSFYYLVL